MWRETGGQPTECSGNGLCDNFGACACDPGYAGEFCELVVKNLPQHMIERALLLEAEVNCRTDSDANRSSCAAAVFTCGTPCTDSQPVVNQDYAVYSAAATLHHVSASGLAVIGGAVVTVSFAAVEMGSNSSDMDKSAIVTTHAIRHCL